MFFHILTRDFKRRKTMNIILLVFIILAAMFLASSVNNLMTVSGALDQFIKISNVPDFFTLSVTNEEKDPIEAFLEKSDEVKEYEVVDTVNLSKENVKILKAGAKEYEQTSTLVMSPLPENFMKIFDLEGQQVTLGKGELAIPKQEAVHNNLQVGDKLRIKFGTLEKEFKIKIITKDAVFGSSMMGFKRLCISEEDFLEYTNQDNIYLTKVYSINYQDKKAFQGKYKKQNFQVLANIEKEAVSTCYVFDMLISGILILVSVCLILIAFLILRFTIIFTLQEDYREIGIMKAIGIKDRAIKRIYLVKYLGISIIGAIVGLLLSFPFEQLLMDKAIVNIVVVETGKSYGINVLCAVFIVVIVLLFCYGSTHRLKKFTAIEAIRNGSKGERYKSKNLIKLHQRKHMRPSLYLACNDVVSNFKRFGVLTIIFCIGTMLILMPLSAIHTLKGNNIAKAFGMAPSDVYLNNGKSDQYMVEEDNDMVLSDIKEVEETLKDNGIDNKVWTELYYIIPCYTVDPEITYNYFTVQSVKAGKLDYDVLEGRAPELANEIMVTEITAQEMDVEIGDSIYYKYPDRTDEYVVTGLFQSMMNMGSGFRVSEKANIDYTYIAGMFGMQVDIYEDMKMDQVFTKIKDLFPEYKVWDVQGFLTNMTGDIVKQMDMMQTFIVVTVLIINSLITVLMMKVIMAKERGEIAMLKSIGFRNGAIKAWQSIRILLVLLLAIILGTLLTKLLAPLVMSPIFGMMGAPRIQLEVKPIEAYFLYPAALLFVTSVVARFCASDVRKVDFKEVNNLE